MGHPTMIRRAAFAALTVAMSACGGSEPPPPNVAPTPAPSAPPVASAAPVQELPDAQAAADAAPPPPVVQVTPPSPEGNPFAGARLATDAAYVAKVEAAAKADPADAALLKKVAAFPTAVWLDSIKSVGRVQKVLDAAAPKKPAADKPGKADKGDAKAVDPVLSVFVVYDLPERDCSAAASGGELTIANGGEKRYASEYIDKIAAAFKAHPKQRIVAIVEPDSLANLATNLNQPKCAAAAPVYQHSIAYAIKTLAMPNVTLYLDAAHAGWLGWDGNRAKIAKIYSDVLAEAGGADKIRGFATNVSNFDSLRGGDLPKLSPSLSCPDELSYIQKLDEDPTKVGITGKGFLIDTSRNGRDGIRTSGGSWCNVKGAGLGERPQANPAPLVDAYYWVKPPGESDGAADPKKPGFDKSCGPDAKDAAPGAPHAGEWFGAYFVELAKNANPPL